MKQIIPLLFLIMSYNVFAQESYPLSPEVWSEPVPLDTSFARPFFWEESPSLTASFDTMYFDRGDGTIHISIKVNGRWQPSIKLNNNINGFSSKYRPSISKDGKRLYFSAWAGYSDWDIWYSDWDTVTNDWGVAKNMGPEINLSGGQYYLYELGKDTIFCLSYGSTDLYAWNSESDRWMKIDSFWYHKLGVGDLMGLSETNDRKKIYFGLTLYHLYQKIQFDVDILVTYWDSTKNYWGDVYSLNIDTRPKLGPDSVTVYGGGEWDPWISPDGKILLFSSNRDAAYDSINTDNSSNLYISHLLVDEHGNPVRIISSPYTKDFHYSLSNFPNPFNSTTTLEYEIPTEGLVIIKLYDTLGREVDTIIRENKKPGIYRIAIEFDSRKLSSGVYYSTLYMHGAFITHKLIYSK